MTIHVTLNGVPRIIEAPGERRLVDLLREDLHMTGTKEGCGIGECGACTVILNGDAVHACLTAAGELDGGELITIEGLENNGELDALQKAFMKNSASQCGFCTAGMILSAKALLMKNPHPTDEELKMAMAGNICRCTGYKEIKNAIREAESEMEEEKEEEKGGKER